MAVTPLQLTGEAARKRERKPLIFDPLLLLAALGLVGMSLMTLRGMESASSAYAGLASRQAIYAAIGLVCCLAVSRFDYSRLREYRYVFYAIIVALNIVVYGMPGANGATRWIPLPFFQLQPSEFGKLLLVLSVSAFMVERSRKAGSPIRTTIRILLLTLFPALIVIGQPDLGTGLVYITIGIAVLFFAGISWKHLIALAAVASVAAAFALAIGPALGVNVLQTYQKQRLTTFVDPPKVCNSQKDPTCYQLSEGETAIGAGRKTGQGTKGASQIKDLFVPEAQDDFVFAAVGDFYGFAGAAAVLLLYALLIWRAVRILTMAKNLYGTLVAGGVLAMLMFQIFLNVGMTIGVMPVTGVPLPLVSYGGSSVLTTFLAIGLLQSVYIQARLASAAKSRVLVV